MPTPEERTIRKTDLWERDDRLNELIQRKAEEIKRLSDAVAIDLDRQMADFKNYVYNLKKDYQVKFEENIMQGIEHLESSVKTQTNGLLDSVEEQNKFINNLFGQFRKESDDKISKDVSDRLDKFNQQSQELRTWWNDYKSIFANQMSKYQADTLARYDELNDKLIALSRDVERIKQGTK